MGCTSSTQRRSMAGRRRRKQGGIHQVAVFAPSPRIPTPVDFLRPLRGLVSPDAINSLSKLRGRIVSLSQPNDIATVLELRRALQEYVPLLLGLTRKEHRLETLVEFKWKSSGDGQETCLASAWYELLSVVHMMGVLTLLEANLILVSSDENERMVSEDSKKAAVDLLLKASGCLDCCIHHILVYLPLQFRKELPSDLQEGVLEAMSTEALAQAVEMQLGLAVECEKATLSVKRRLACEAVSYLSQAHHSLSACYTSDPYGKKLLLFIRWKFLEAKASAYYFHGLVVNKGNHQSDQIASTCCHFAADELLTESKRACLSFCLAPPITRTPPVWGVMKHLIKKIPEAAAKRSQMYGHLFDQGKGFQSLPDLPEFPLSLKPDEYGLPDIDVSWDCESCRPQIQTLKEHMIDDEDRVNGN